MKKKNMPNVIKTFRVCVVIVLLILLISVVFTGCSTGNALDSISEALGIDVSSGSETSNYDTHSGNGDGTSCIVLSFNDDTVLEKIKDNAEWKAFPLDETVQTLVYGIEGETGKSGPYLTDDGNPLVPEIQNGYYLLIDRQDENDQAAEEDILHRSSFNFSLGLYDTDTNTLYFCQLDT